jgi:hypothetical protein
MNPDVPIPEGCCLSELPEGAYTDPSFEGLTLRVRSRNVRSWCLRYKAALCGARGPQRRITFGRLNEPVRLDLNVLGLSHLGGTILDLSGARRIALELKAMANAGADPMTRLRGRADGFEKAIRAADARIESLEATVYP